jgi:hypothetical protein
MCERESSTQLNFAPQQLHDKGFIRSFFAFTNIQGLFDKKFDNFFLNQNIYFLFRLYLSKRMETNIFVSILTTFNVSNTF